MGEGLLTPGAAELHAPAGLRRWWIYQRERFPLLAHGPLIAAFSISGVSFSAALRGSGSPAFAPVVVAFLTALCFFVQLRVADEIKDAAADARYRPYRPVPRGLVTLGELRVIGLWSCLIQVGAALVLDARLLIVLALVWAYMGLMRREFFASAWLRTRPLTVLWTHMLVMPLIDLYVTACDWLPMNAPVAPGLRWFLIASFFNGMVVEIGRKIRAPGDEEHGVDTYSALWGRRRAVLTWLSVMLASLLCAISAARVVGAASWTSAILSMLFGAALITSVAFHRSAQRGTGRRLELLSGVWTLAVYLTLGVSPWLVSHV